MNKYIIKHLHNEEEMVVEAGTRAKAKYKNFKDWDDAGYSRPYKNKLKGYLGCLVSCKKMKEVDDENIY